MKTFNWSDYVFIGLLVLATVLAGMGYYEAYTFGETGRIGTARVKSSESGRQFSSSAVLTTNVSGADTDYRISMWFEHLTVGEQVEILYLVNAPVDSKVQLRSFWSRYRQPTLFLIFVAIFWPLMIVKGLRAMRDSQLNVTEAQTGN